jgi:hypothetical protein
MMPLSGGVPGQPLGGSREVVQAGSQRDQLKLGVSMDCGNPHPTILPPPKVIIAGFGPISAAVHSRIIIKPRERPLGPQNGG